MKRTWILCTRIVCDSNGGYSSIYGQTKEHTAAATEGEEEGGREMCLVFGCGEEEKALGTYKAPGSCPYCGGVVMATDVEKSLRLCCLPVCLKTTTKYSCTHCSRRLVTYP
ncbi:hypothetical protein BHM03_00032256 [Ensete ventricosum]|nr:hypothetical protein BHM03_00032256 [Ensete ventricosum]